MRSVASSTRTTYCILIRSVSRAARRTARGAGRRRQDAGPGLTHVLATPARVANVLRAEGLLLRDLESLGVECLVDVARLPLDEDRGRDCTETLRISPYRVPSDRVGSRPAEHGR